MTDSGFKLYILFVFSWFLHLGSRFSVLGAIRIDLLLVAILFLISIMNNYEQESDSQQDNISKMLIILIAYAILTVPLVEWPGSVLKRGIINFVKAVIFYFFTVKFIRTERQLKIFIGAFVLFQTFRVLEPVYLHITQGYWGSAASMANWEFMYRLSGAPSDVINPNGLAFVILTTIPFYYYFFSSTKLTKVLTPAVMIILMYALKLTASRSGFLGLIIIIISFIIKTEKKMVLIVVVGLCGIVFFSTLNPNQKDRYISIFDSSSKNAVTAEGRIEGVKKNFEVAFRRPFFGHGLGTSREANANFGNSDKPAHNLYAEVAQELGFIGLIIFLFYIKAVIVQVSSQMKSLRKRLRPGHFLFKLNNSLQVWFAMNLLFSLASYGVSSYEWYLFPGLCAVLSRISGTGFVEEEVQQDAIDKKSARS
jgi:putative inorganic carbon (HCO3(-)) transporter